MFGIGNNRFQSRTESKCELRYKNEVVNNWNTETMLRTDLPAD